MRLLHSLTAVFGLAFRAHSQVVPTGTVVAAKVGPTLFERRGE
jgi:hypothetical protein